MYVYIGSCETSDKLDKFKILLLMLFLIGSMLSHLMKNTKLPIRKRNVRTSQKYLL